MLLQEHVDKIVATYKAYKNGENAEIENENQLIGDGNTDHLRLTDLTDHKVIKHIDKVGYAVLYKYRNHKGENVSVKTLVTNKFVKHRKPPMNYSTANSITK